MKTREADDRSSIGALLDYLNACHDGVIRRMSFAKERAWNQNGDLVYPFTNLAEKGKCEIDMELLLNSYVGASTQQVIQLSFKDVRSFRFAQESSSDYSDVCEVTFSVVSDHVFEFLFSEAARMTVFLSLQCSKVVCRETD